MKHITEFFLLCSGVNRQILEECPGEKTKYVGLGATIFFTGVFAFLAASYALFFVFDDVLVSIIFGFIWGLMIFNLDRYIVSTMRKSGSFFREFLSALPRIIVAVIISIVIAKPLELRIFQKEIEPELILMEQRAFEAEENQVRARFTKTETELQAQLDGLNKILAEKGIQRDALLKIAQEEADGTGGSRKKNLGPIYKLKKADVDKAQKELDEYRLNEGEVRKTIMKKSTRNDSLRNAALSKLEFAHRDGPAARMEALENLKQKSTPIRWASLFVMLLILAIETAPVFVKLISAKGPYDNLIRIEEFSFSTKEKEQVAKISSVARNSISELHDQEQNYLSNQLDNQLKT
jgi:hypothetical protein